LRAAAAGEDEEGRRASRGATASFPLAAKWPRGSTVKSVAPGLEGAAWRDGGDAGGWD
jgi:hypothetical protein